MGQLIAGRFIMGMGVGQAGVVGPIYLAEVAPTASRGLLVGLYASSEYVGVLIGLRGFSPEDPRIIEEVQSIKREVSSKKTTGKSKWPFLRQWKALFARANLHRWMFLLSAQLLSQWSGTNAITTYAPKFFALLNVTGKSEKLFKTAIFGVVKLVSALISAFFFVDRFGRKRTLLGGIVLQLLALLYIAIFMTAWDAAGKPDSSNALRAAAGSVAALYVTGVGYAFGWNCIQYLINAEILPSEVRTLGTSLLMCVHYANKFALVKALPSMMLDDALQPKGTFWFFFAVASIGLVWGIVWLPETSQKSLEETSTVFEKQSTKNP
ncbi:quinate permease [Aspergillus luchuensis IFO 4308]|nr:quinate permease [Aspergillus luchuensis IFO 4308]